jgi:hypothetical protein
MSLNKFSKQPPESSPSAASGFTYEPTDRLAWDMQNIRQFYHSRASNSTPSSSILNSPDLDYDRSLDQYQHFSDKIDKRASDAGHDFLGVNVNFTNTLVSGLSPTSSHSSNSENFADLRSRNIGGLQITNLRESPRRPGGSQSNGQTSRKSSNASQEIPRVFMQLSNRRAPGFPKVSQFISHEWIEDFNNSNHFSVSSPSHQTIRNTMTRNLMKNLKAELKAMTTDENSKNFSRHSSNKNFINKNSWSTSSAVNSKR